MDDEVSLDPLGAPTTSTSSSSQKARPARQNTSAMNKMLSLLASPALSKSIQSLTELLNQVKGGAGSPGAPAMGGSGASQVANAVSKSQSMGTGITSASGGKSFQNFMGGFTGGGGVPGGSPGALKGGAGASAVLQLGTMGLSGIDNRVNNAYAQMLSYDKLSMLYQQTQGISQNRFANAVLQPLSQYKLGQGGASTLLGLQASTGLSAQGNAESIAGLRAATGFAYSTQDMAQMMRTMASPMVNNRMTMTLGTGMYGPGGSQRNMMEVVQQIVRGAGLTDARSVEGGMQIGSVTRARLSAYGVPEDMHDMILQYAKTNVQYQKKGGKGMYNPNDKTAQKLMGVDKNFANEQEETQRVSEARDMQFYKRQADNYAQLERNTQGLIKAFGALEDKLSGIIGTRVSTRNSTGIAIGKTVLGGAMVLGGIAGAKFTGGASLALSAYGVSQIGAGLKGFTPGDPMPGGRDYSVGYGGGRKSLSEVNGVGFVAKLNPKFRERILKMMQENPAVGIGSGHRESDVQRTMFTDRYLKTDEKTDIFWEGSYWKKKDGVAPAAPPGFSMHEIGLAADLTGDLDWVQKNAHRFGLKTFGGVNGEPWHVQPAELPNSRVEYEKSGASWGLGGSSERADPSAVISGITDGDGSGHRFGSGRSGGPMSFGQVGIMGSIEATKEANRLNLGASGVSAFAGSSASSTASSTGAGTSVGSIKRGGRRGKMKPEEVAQLLFAAGFRGDDLAKALAISYRESNHNSGALNNNEKTKDMSYGLFQINMHKNLGPWRRKRFNLQSDEDLFEPDTNIRVAKGLYDMRKKEGKDPFHDWGPYKKKSPTYGRADEFLPKARAIAKQIEGDPMPIGKSSGGGGGGTFVEGASININAPINIQAGATFDPHQVGVEAGRLIERQLKIAMMRKN